MKKSIGIIFADDMEYKPFEDFASPRGGVTTQLCGCNKITLEMDNVIIHAIESGIGKVNAAAATCFLKEQCGVDMILNAGLSGAVSGLKREDVIAGESYVECDFDLRIFNYKLGQKPAGEYIYFADKNLLDLALTVQGVKKAKLGTGDFFLADKLKKDEYLNEFSINAFDMETAAIAAVSEKYGLPFLSLRKVSDDADDESVYDYRDMNEKCESTLTEVLIEIIKSI